MTTRLRRAAAFALFFLVAATAAAPALSAAEAPAGSPRLLAVIVVDQMRADYLERFGDSFKGGFRRLLDEGAVFANARLGYVNAETSPGHASIITGKSPSRHGIVANDWYDRDGGAWVNSAKDPLFDRGPAQLLAYGLGDALKARDPESKVAAMSGKDRSAVFLGGRKPDLVLWYDNTNGFYATSRYYGALPGWVDGFNQEGRADQFYLRTHPEVGSRPVRRTPTRYYAELVRDPYFDRMLLDLALTAVRKMRLGRDDHPDLLAVSFSATDYIGHRKGPDSIEMRVQLRSLDGILGELFEALDREVGRGRYTVVLTADHGVQPMPEEPARRAAGARRILIRDMQEAAEAALRRRLPPLPAGGEDRWVLGIYPPHVYLNRPLAAKLGLERGRLLSEAAAALKSVDGIAEAFRADDLAEGRPLASSYADDFARSFYAPRSGDLLILTREDVLAAWDEVDTQHSTPYDYDARIPMVFWGARIRTGRYTEPALVIDAAPTAGRLLGLDFPPVPEGRARLEILW